MANAAQILNEIYFLPTDKLVQSGQVRTLYNDRKCGQCPRVFRKVFGLGRHLQQAHGAQRQAFEYATTTRIELPNLRAPSPAVRRREHYSSASRAYSFPSSTIAAPPVAKKRLSLEDLDASGEDDENWIPGKKERRMAAAAASTPAYPTMALRKSRSRVPRTLFPDTDEEDDDEIVEIDVDDDDAAAPKKSRSRKSPDDVTVTEGAKIPEEGDVGLDMECEDGTDMEYDTIEETGQSPSLSNVTEDSGLGAAEDGDGEYLTVDCDPIIHDDFAEDAGQNGSDVIDLESDCDDAESVRSLSSSGSLSDGSVVEILSSSSSTASNEENTRRKGNSSTADLIRDINEKVPLVRLERISLPNAAFVNGTYNVGKPSALQRLTGRKNVSAKKRAPEGKGKTNSKEVAAPSCHDSVREFLASGSDDDDDLEILEVIPIDKTRRTSPFVEAKIEDLLSGLIYFAVNRVESKTVNAQVLAESVVDDMILDSVRRVEQEKSAATQEASVVSPSHPSSDPEQRVDQEVTEGLHGCEKTQDLGVEENSASCDEVSKNASEEQRDNGDETDISVTQSSDAAVSMTESTRKRPFFDLPLPPAKRACRVSEWLGTCPRVAHDDSQSNLDEEIVSVESKSNGSGRKEGVTSNIMIEKIVLQLANLAVSKTESSKIPSPVPRKRNEETIRSLPFPPIMKKACQEAQESREDATNLEMNNNDNLNDGNGKKRASASVLANEIVLQITDEAVSRAESSKVPSSMTRKRNGGQNLPPSPSKKRVCQKPKEARRATDGAADDDDVEVIFVDGKEDDDLEVVFNDNLAVGNGQKRETKYADAEQMVLLMADIAVWLAESSKVRSTIPRKRPGGIITVDLASQGLVPLQPAKKRVVQKAKGQNQNSSTEDEDVEVIFID